MCVCTHICVCVHTQAHLPHPHSPPPWDGVRSRSWGILSTTKMIEGGWSEKGKFGGRWEWIRFGWRIRDQLKNKELEIGINKFFNRYWLKNEWSNFFGENIDARVLMGRMRMTWGRHLEKAGRCQHSPWCGGLICTWGSLYSAGAHTELRHEWGGEPCVLLLCLLEHVNMYLPRCLLGTCFYLFTVLFLTGGICMIGLRQEWIDTWTWFWVQF